MILYNPEVKGAEELAKKVQEADAKELVQITTAQAGLLRNCHVVIVNKQEQKDETK
jgi:hypothetical protein